MEHGPDCPDCGGEMHMVETYEIRDSETGEVVAQFTYLRDAMVFSLDLMRKAEDAEGIAHMESMIARYDEERKMRIN